MFPRRGTRFKARRPHFSFDADRQEAELSRAIYLRTDKQRGPRDVLCTRMTPGQVPSSTQRVIRRQTRRRYIVAGANNECVATTRCGNSAAHRQKNLINARDERKTRFTTRIYRVFHVMEIYWKILYARYISNVARIAIYVQSSQNNFTRIQKLSIKKGVHYYFKPY